MSPDSGIQANAWWDNVAATLHGPTVSAMPSSIRLEFQITYSPPNTASLYDIAQPNLVAQGLVGTGVPALTSAGTPLQPGEPAVQALSNGLLSGTFHLDLPLSATGTSQQFSLGLTSDLDLFKVLYSWPGTLQLPMSLSLTGIYLPDGTPIAAAGDSVTFDSGLPPPIVAPVPEPTSVAAWCLLAAGAAMKLHRRKRSSGISER